MLLDPAARKKRIAETAREVLSNAPVYLDTETTGLERMDEIVEIAIISSDGTPLVNTLVRPSQPIPLSATAIHHITPGMVEKALSWPAIWPTVRAHLLGKPIVIYNADFDLRMMQQSHARYRLPWKDSLNTFDLLKLYAEFRGDWDSIRRSYRYISLDTAGKQCGIPLPNSHRAADDALLTRSLLEYLANYTG